MEGKAQMPWTWWQYSVEEQGRALRLQHPSGEPTTGPYNSSEISLAVLSPQRLLQCLQHLLL